MTATTGLVHLRTRISYSGAGAIDPCGTAVYGETEDYKVNITAASGINELSPELVSIYPNPTKDIITLDFGALEASSIKVYDLFGKEVISIGGVINQKSELSLGAIAQGMYHVKINTPMGVITKTLVKN